MRLKVFDKPILIHLTQIITLIPANAVNTGTCVPWLHSPCRSHTCRSNLHIPVDRLAWPCKGRLMLNYLLDACVTVCLRIKSEASQTITTHQSRSAHATLRIHTKSAEFFSLSSERRCCPKCSRRPLQVSTSLQCLSFSNENRPLFIKSDAAPQQRTLRPAGTTRQCRRTASMRPRGLVAPRPRSAATQAHDQVPAVPEPVRLVLHFGTPTREYLTRHYLGSHPCQPSIPICCAAPIGPR